MKVTILPILLMKESDLTIFWCDLDVGEGNGSTVNEVVIELGVLGNIVRLPFEDVNTFVDRDLVVLFFAKDIDNICKLTTIQPSFLNDLLINFCSIFMR
jgi:hypothetical protein